ncbi:MAG: flagellar biosynthesis anti-sigma factor FlgM [Oscillospiraceae bacterium]
MDVRLNALHHYANTGSVAKLSPEKAQTPTAQTREAKTDTVSFSAGAAGNREVSGVCAGIRADLDGLSSPDRVAQIKAQVANGSYVVSADDVAAAVLSRFA